MIVIDTGPLVAAANERDNHHERCLDYLETAPGPLIVPAPVVVEVCYFLESRRGHHASATFLHQLVDGYPHLYRADRSGPATHGAPRWPVHRPSAGSSHLAGSCSQVSTKSGCLVCTGSTSPAVITSTTRVAPPPSSSTSMTSTPPGPSRALPRARSGCPPDAARPGAAQSPGRPPPSPAEASAGQLAYGRLAGSP